MLSQQVRKRLIGEFLKILHAIPCQQIKGMPSLIIELYALAGHCGLLIVARHCDNSTDWRPAAISPACSPTASALMDLSLDIRANGKAGVSVEEYERPIAKTYAAVQQFQLQAEPTDLGIVL
jgi:hypothetical protein